MILPLDSSTLQLLVVTAWAEWLGTLGVGTLGVRMRMRLTPPATKSEKERGVAEVVLDPAGLALVEDQANRWLSRALVPKHLGQLALPRHEDGNPPLNHLRHVPWSGQSSGVHPLACSTHAFPFGTTPPGKVLALSSM